MILLVKLVLTTNNKLNHNNNKYMGDRISISFKKDEEESVILFSHWDGMTLLEKAKNYIKELKTDIENDKISISTPLTRLQPNTVIVDFIRWYTKNIERIDSNYYLGKDKNDGDNSDNGHHTIKL